MVPRLNCYALLTGSLYSKSNGGTGDGIFLVIMISLMINSLLGIVTECANLVHFLIRRIEMTDIRFVGQRHTFFVLASPNL